MSERKHLAEYGAWDKDYHPCQYGIEFENNNSANRYYCRWCNYHYGDWDNMKLGRCQCGRDYFLFPSCGDKNHDALRLMNGGYIYRPS